MKNPNGYGSVIKLAGNRRKPYAVRLTKGYKPNGTANYFYLGYFSNIKDAKQCLAAYNRNPYEANNQTFAELWALFEEDVLKFAKDSMVHNRRIAFDHFAEVHDIPFNKIKAVQLQNCINKFDSPSVQSNMRSTYGALERYAMKHEIISQSKASLIDTKPIKLKHERGYFTEEEIEELWKHTDEPIIKDALILIYSGWRISEYLNLTKKDIRNGCMFGGMKTENGIDRYVPIHPRIMPFIQEKLDNPKRDYLNSTTNSNAFRYHWNKSELLAHHVIHETRHTFRTRLDNENANKVCIDLLMGHASSSIGERVYTHKSLEQLKNTILLLK